MTIPTGTRGRWARDDGDRMVAYELAVSARYNGKVALIITRQKQAEAHCLGLQRLGLPVTMEPHDVER